MNNHDGPKTELLLLQQQQELLRTCVEALGSMSRSMESLVANYALLQQSTQDNGRALAELEGRMLRMESYVGGNGTAPVE